MSQRDLHVLRLRGDCQSTKGHYQPVGQAAGKSAHVSERTVHSSKIDIFLKKWFLSKRNAHYSKIYIFLKKGFFPEVILLLQKGELLTLLAKFDSCGPALEELEIPPCVPVCDVVLFPVVVPEYPAVPSFDLAPRFLEPSRSLSTVGSSLSCN